MRNLINRGLSQYISPIEYTYLWLWSDGDRAESHKFMQSLSVSQLERLFFRRMLDGLDILDRQIWFLTGFGEPTPVISRHCQIWETRNHHGKAASPIWFQLGVSEESGRRAQIIAISSEKEETAFWTRSLYRYSFGAYHRTRPGGDAGSFRFRQRRSIICRRRSRERLGLYPLRLRIDNIVSQVLHSVEYRRQLRDKNESCLDHISAYGSSRVTE
jgi:hypothetical protein